jgi:hypothetical protein
MNKRQLAIVVVATFCLMMLLTIPLERSTPDPWADTSGPTPGQPDGKVNMRDIAYEINQFNANLTGIPRSVMVNSYLSAVSSALVVIPAHSIVNLNVSTDGYQHLDIGFWNTTAMVNSVNTRVGFLVDQKYSNVDTFNLPAAPIPVSHPTSGNIMWTHGPPTTGSIGYKFNVTVWLRLEENSSAWQVCLRWDSGVLGYQRFGFTATNESDWATHSIAPSSIINTNSSEADSLICGEAISSYVPPVTASLVWVEFKTLSPYFETTVELANYGTDTFIINPKLNLIPFEPFNSVWTQDYTIRSYDLEKTYTIAGPTMTIEMINPNDFDAWIHVEVFLTTAPNG